MIRQTHADLLPLNHGFAQVFERNQLVSFNFGDFLLSFPPAARVGSQVVQVRHLPTPPALSLSDVNVTAALHHNAYLPPIWAAPW